MRVRVRVLVSTVLLHARALGVCVPIPCLFFFFFYWSGDHRDLHSFPTRRSSDLYLNAKGALTYTDIAGDPVLYGNLPPREISMKDVFRSGDSSKKFKIAEGQWYRKLLRQITRTENILHRNFTRRQRSEERLSRNAETDLVCRLLLEKKNSTIS